MSFGAAVVVGVVGGAVALAIMTVSGRPRRLSHRVGLALLWLWGCGVAGLTFGTRSGGGQAVNIAPLNVANSADRVDFVLNVIMFLPAGLLLVVLGLRWYQAAVLGLLASLSIEVTQYLTSSGRTADINDLLSNTVGCLLGAAVATAFRRRRGPALVDREPEKLLS